MKRYTKPEISVLTFEAESLILSDSQDIPKVSDMIFNMSVLQEIKTESADNAMSKGTGADYNLWTDDEDFED